MSIKTEKVSLKHLLSHETKKSLFIKFLVLVSILAVYTIYLASKHGIATGGLLAAISWSFFVLCTPVADGGMLIDFPIRLLFKIKMFISEIVVWGVAILINFYAFFIHPEVYTKSALGHIFYEILAHPVPYWSIILFSLVGTFLSVNFADKLLTYIKHSDIKHSAKMQLVFEGVVMVTIFLLILFIYKILLDKFGIDVSGLK